MKTDAAALVAGPRGRSLCLNLAFAYPAQTALAPRIWRLAERISELRAGISSLSPPDLLAVDSLALALAELPLPPLDETMVFEALVNTVDEAVYWDEPDGEDALLSHPAMAGFLDRIATHIAASACVSWWNEPMVTEQFQVQLTDPTRPTPPKAPSPEDALRTWRHSEQADRGWWSTPPWPLRASTREIPIFGYTGLWLIEDGFGESSATVDRLAPLSSARIFEVSDASRWAELCRAHPLDVTAGKGPEWTRATGRAGRWVIPDWSLVAREYDAIHLPVAAYLAAAGTAIPVGADTASVIAGWNPDETHWLTDVATDPATRALWMLDPHTDRWVPRDSTGALAE